jgi:DNA recombination protein RmuC
LDGANADPEQIAVHHTRHARNLRDHVKLLSQKGYWQQFNNQKETPDFVVMFVPGEHFLSIALQQDPELFDYAFANRVIMATPINLIGLLKTVAHAWRQEKLAEQAEKIAKLGKDLYEAMAGFAGHFENMGDSLRKSVEHYNKSVASFESRALVRARRLADEYSIESDKKIELLQSIDIAPRPLAVAEETPDMLAIPEKKQEVA